MKYVFALVFVTLSQLVIAQKQDEGFSTVDELLVFSEPSEESIVSFHIKKMRFF